MKRVYAQKVNMTISSDVVELFAQKMAERGETNRSKIVEFLMVCWIYSHNGVCDPQCPYFEEEGEKEG